MNETRDLTAFLVKLKYDDLPADVVKTAKLCLLDTVGVGLFASKMEWTRIVAGTVGGAGGSAESAAWGLKSRLPAQYAALVNGTAAHGIEMDDRFGALSIHTGAMTIPAALAAAEKAHATGKRLLESIVMGYEVAFRVGRAVPLQTERGLHPAGHKGIWGAVAASTKALGLDEEQAINAFGIAGSMASGIWEFSQDPRRNMVKRFHGGWSSHNGVLAAMLAMGGLTGPGTVLEGKFGYCNVFKGGVDPHIDELAKDLGKRFQILDREVKPYSAWGGSHPTIDAVVQAKSKLGIKPEQIERITIAGPSIYGGKHDIKKPESLMAGQYSLPFITAMAFYGDLRDPSVWTNAALADKKIIDLCARVEVVTDPAREALYHKTLGFQGTGVTA
ncbi:MAG: MmgE/PrpD family protein, partial [Chloroflexi bacterium]|nr:MmgE/PrpD family protein [Chloroflexota bacterium]